jgi:hypothetical protein
VVIRYVEELVRLHAACHQLWFLGEMEIQTHEQMNRVSQQVD